MPKIFSVILVALHFCSCSSKNDEMVSAKRDTILGKWQLFETCISPGNSCVLKKINDGVIIEFKENGEYLLSNTNKGEGVLTCGGEFELIEIQTNPTQHAIEFKPSCNKALWTFNLVFNQNNTININPQCFEECRYTYKPVD